MTGQDPQIEALFYAALEKGDLQQQLAFLREACGENVERFEQLKTLLESHNESRGPLDSPAFEVAETSALPPHDLVDSRIGPYRVMQKIGEGGMGMVYMAEQKEPIQRRVALKLVKPGMDTRQVIARFDAERHALALMDHPNIAKVLDAGETEQGRPYFVMELVKGIPITSYCDEHHLDLRQRLELFVAVCQAAQHAHQKGIIHRDLKPSNILVTEYENRAVPKIIDFGVAKALNQQLTDQTVYTQFDQVIGTLEYMSPEQARLNQLDVDTRSDIYSLSAVLYELIAGVPPLDSTALKSHALDEMLRAIRESDPPRPSMRLSSSDSLPSLAANRHSEPRKLTSAVRGDLDWITMKGLDKDRARRYSSANDLVLDVQHYLRHEPVSACPPSALYRMRKFVRRNRAAVAAAILILMALVGGGIGTLSQYTVARSYYDQLRIEVGNVKKQEKIASRHKEAAERAIWDFYLLVSDSPELLGGAPGTQRLRKELLGTARDYYADFVGNTDSDSLDYERGIASNRLALVEFDLGDVTAALQAHQESSRHWRRLCETSPESKELRHYYAGSLLGWAKAEYTAGRLDDAEQHSSQAREVLVELLDERPDSREYQEDLAWSYNVLGNVLLLRESTAEAIENFEQAIAVSEQMLTRDPSDKRAASRMAGCCHNISAVLKQVGRLDEAVVYSRRSLEISRGLLERFPENERCLSDLAGTETNLGVILSMKGVRDEALSLHRSALEKYRRAVEMNPSIPAYREGMAKAHNSIGIILEDFGRNEEAGEEYSNSIAFREPLVAKHPEVPEYAKELIKNYGNMARIHTEQGNRQAALENISRAVALAEDLTNRFVDTPEYFRLLSQSCNQLGQYYHKGGDYDKAEENFERALAIAVDGSDEVDDTALYDSEVTGALRNLASLSRTRGDLAGAEAYYTRVIQRLEDVNKRDRTASARLGTLTLTHANIAEILGEQGRQGEAIKAYEKAIAAAQRLFDNTTEVPATRGLLPATLCNLGLLHNNAGDYDRAEARLSASLRCAEVLAQENPDSEKAQEYLQIASSNLALVYANTERLAEALKLYEQVVSYSGPENLVIRAVRAVAARQAGRQYQRVGDLTKALDRFRLAVQLGQTLMDSSATPEQSCEMMQACCDLGGHLAWAKNPDESRLVFQRGITVGERLVKTHPTTGHRLGLVNLYYEAGNLEHQAFRSATAQDFYSRAIELQEELRQKTPDSADHESLLARLYVNLANCLENTDGGRLDALGQAIEIGLGLVKRSPDHVTYRVNLMTAQLNRAITYDALNKLAESRDDYLSAVETSHLEPGDGSDEPQLATKRVPALVNLGLVYGKLNQEEEAIECNREAIALGTKLVQDDPTLVRVRIDTAGGQVNQASIFRNRGDERRALELLQSARGSLAEVLSSDEWGSYARTFLTNSLAAERRCYGSLLHTPPQGDDLELVETALKSSIDWSESQLKRWSTDHANYPLLAGHLAGVRDARGRLRATDPRETVRRGVEAVADAARACDLTSYQVWQFIDTLAAAYAEVGSFDDAVERQRQAVEMAPEQQRGELQRRLDLYLKGEVYRQDVGEGEDPAPAEKREGPPEPKQA